jgi:glycerate 2-kinase
MHLLIAPDSFKDALGAKEVAEAFARGIHRARPDWTYTMMPLADGGEGTARIMTEALGGEMVTAPCSDPLGRPITATYGQLYGRNTAIIELAAASGIQLLQLDERNPLCTSTYGTGQLIRHAIEAGAEHIYLTLGSSATNDGGCGMAAALGFQFYNGNTIIERPTGADLSLVTEIGMDTVMPQLAATGFTVLCDVDNPFFGARGAAKVYARQKGAKDAEIELLEKGMTHLAGLLKIKTGVDLQHLPGSGAAGGTGGGASVFLKASLIRGIEAILKLSRFSDGLPDADWVITGEGRIDDQTLTGKVVKGVAEACRKYEVPVIGICGLLQLDDQMLRQLGLQAAFPISNGARSLEEALRHTAADVERLAFHLARVIEMERQAPTSHNFPDTNFSI